MKKGKTAVLIILIAALGGGGWYCSRYGWPLESVIPLESWVKSVWPFKSDNKKETVYVTQVKTLMGVSSGAQNRYAGVVEAQDTVKIQVDKSRKVKELFVKEGDEVKTGQLLFEYDQSSIEDDLKQAQLDMDRLKNEAVSLESQIATLEKEKSEAKADAQLSYTIEIETNRMNLKKNEYDQESKQAQIEKLQNATGNTEVRSEIDGLIQKIDESKMNSGTDNLVSDVLVSDSLYSTDGNDAFITILSTGVYRIKGMVNELNISDVVPGVPVLIRSRADETQTWRGVLESVDMESSKSDSGSFVFDSSGGMTSSSSYPFYVQMESSEGLMLGQHVLIELDEGQNDQKEGVWLTDYFIAGTDTSYPYVWVEDDNGKIRKRDVILGTYDQGLKEYEILDGLTNDDYIAYPAASVKEGMTAVHGTGSQTMQSMMEEVYSDDFPQEDMGLDAFSEGEILDDYFDADFHEDGTVSGGMVVEDDAFPEEGAFADDFIIDSGSPGLMPNEGVYDEQGNMIEENFGPDDMMGDPVLYDENGNIVQ